MKNLKQLFVHQLKDLFSAEKQLLEALPKMVENASDSQLKKAFENHFEETKVQLKRIEEICREMNISPSGEKCKAMEGLIKEAEGFIKEAAGDDVMDAGLIAEAQRVEHYEISGYGTAVRYAKELGHPEIAKKLQETLNEEYAADEKLNQLAENRVNREAMV
ncbi:ferritin-like domain-containing protein [Euzebyella marina]|uniref:Ferritin-like domain-containing protein n=1 Tax=Euzebyella marina TaxID=1761453 RepID=A0A3G2L5T6_9FLAO|nr:ferritin-like domain-containing protein [Euzebyella marina]AYN67608.1 ferritin-like domain-containing protein [Euzebyella marina]